jgi:hypothetical protein
MKINFKNKMLIKKTNKKAVSVMVGYVLLIIISLSLAAAVYAWLIHASDIEPLDSCEKGVSLIVNDYGYEEDSEKLIINLKNKGNFNISGFFIKVTDKEDVVPYIDLIPVDSGGNLEGRYDFKPSDYVPLAPEEIIQANFTYDEEDGDRDTIKKLQIIPYRRMENEKGIKEIVRCNNAKRIIDIDWEKALQGAPTSSLGDDDDDDGGDDGGGEEKALQGAPTSSLGDDDDDDGGDDGGGEEIVIPDSLVSWWRFDDRDDVADKIKDEQGNHDADIVTSPDFVNAKIGKGMKVESGLDYAKITSNLDDFQIQEFDNFTIEAWINITEVLNNDFAYIFEEFDNDDIETNYGLKIGKNKKIEFYYGGNKVIESSNQLEENEWYFIVITKVVEDFTLYIKDDNGDVNEIISKTSTNFPTYSDNDVVNIGIIENGAIDEVAFYNEALDETR